MYFDPICQYCLISETQIIEYNHSLQKNQSMTYSSDIKSNDRFLYLSTKQKEDDKGKSYTLRLCSRCSPIYEKAEKLKAPSCKKCNKFYFRSRSKYCLYCNNATNIVKIFREIKELQTIERLHGFLQYFSTIELIDLATKAQVKVPSGAETRSTIETLLLSSL